jgi:hypothetical protein
MYPWLCRLLLRRSGEYPTSETEIVIEGFPRSGNTFAVIAFQAAQPRLVSVAHHVHAPAPVITASRMGIPALVLVRHPEEAVLSTLVRYPHLTIRQALRGYARFHAPLVKLGRGFVVARFEEVVSAFGPVIRRVNAAFGSNFAEFEHNEANVDRAFRSVDQWDRGALAGEEELRRGRARPTEARSRLKDGLRDRYQAPGLAGPRSTAEDLHAALTAAAGPPH